MRKKWNVFFSFIRFAYACHKPYFFVVAFQAIVNMANALFNVYSLSLILDFLETKSWERSFTLGCIVVGANLIFNFLRLFINRLMKISGEKIAESINQGMTRKLMRVPFQYLEDPYYLDMKAKAKFAIENMDNVKQFLDSVATMIQIVVTLIGLLSVLFLLDLLLVAVLITAVILHVLMTVISLKMQVRFYADLMPVNRRFGYYLNVLLNRKNAKDFRMYPIGALMTNRFAKYADTTSSFFQKHEKKATVVRVFSEVVKYVEMGLVYGFVAVKTIVERLSIGAFSLTISSALAFSANMTKLIDVMLNLTRCVSYMEPFVELLGLKEEQDDGKQIVMTGDIESIEFQNVVFSYPKSQDIVLNDISFSISRGQKISIVGLNGAGKTTLIKLLCRLYHPQSGTIKINGISIDDYEYRSYIRHISAVFQDYQLFAYSLKENILNENGDPQLAYEIAAKVGLKAKIDSLPDGIETPYSKIYNENGIELSGGEGQKVAIARALYKNSSIIILDEPTSALDPMAEAEIYQHFNELIQDKTAIYISHRMSSSVFCDKVLILDQGKVLDFDTHKKLMKKEDSLYFKLFTSQAINYQIHG
ncbi:MAG: hypothetical protein A2Y16_05945 [Tenericutes bacterium GWF2_57_13]|nr:MAG: hypothetical protein A2Y16_05945 [Tenericutes bacterium GWF2_57_13]